MRGESDTLHRVDLFLLAIIISLLAFGVISVYSASYAASQERWGEPTRLLIRQVRWALLGVMAMGVVAAIDYTVWRQFAIPIMIVALILLVLVLIMPTERFGARRALFNGSVQPSELAKLAVVIYIAAWLASREKTLRDIRLGLIPFSVLLGIITMLIVSEPDFSTSILVVATAMTMFFIAGADLKQVGIAVIVLGLTFALLISQSEHALARVQQHIEFLRDPTKGGSDHVRLAVLLLAQGGIVGDGPGATQLDPSVYLPLGWSDAILAVVGRDAGLIGTLLVVGLFAGLMYRGFRIALHADDNFGTLLASGVTFWLVFQAIINIGVVTAVIPFTGMPLPFISYGGSSMVAAMTGIGLLLSVSRGTRQEEKGIARVAFGRRNWRPRVSRSGRRPRAGGSRRRHGGQPRKPHVRAP